MVTLLSKGKCCERKLLNSILLSKFLQLVLNHRNCIARHRHLRPQGTYFAGHIRLLRSCLGFFFFSFFCFNYILTLFGFAFSFFLVSWFFFWFFFYLFGFIYVIIPPFLLYIYNLFVIIYVRLTQKLNKENGYNSLFLTSLSASGLKKYYKIIK